MRHLAPLFAISLLGGLAACDRSDTTSVLSPSASNEFTASGAVVAAFAQGSSLDSANDVLNGVDLASPETGSYAAPSLAAASAGTSVAGRLAGRAAGSEVTILPGLSDTGAGYVTFSGTQSFAWGTQTDTVRLGWRSGAADTTAAYWLRGSKVWSTGMTDLYSLVPENGTVLSAGRAWMDSRRIFSTGLIHHARMLADPGTDGSYGTEADNRIWNISWQKIKGSDTLARAQVANADSTLPLTGATRLVASAWEGAVPAHPLQKSRSWSLVATINGADTTIVSLKAVRVGKYGRIDSVTTRNANGSAFTGAGDTVVVRHFVQYAGQTDFDTLLSSEATMKVRLTKGLGKEGNYLLGVTARRDHRLGAISTSQFSWTAITEVLQGTEPVDGKLLYVAILRDGRKATLDGTFGNGVIDGTWTAPDGTVTVIHQIRK
jgi:hypothetical protein